MRILLVKLSSLGDVIHNLPVVSDIVTAFPHAEIDWAIEPPYAEIATLHPRVRTAIPVPLRRLKQNWGSIFAWQSLFESRRQIALAPYDAVLDTQGLVKSAWIASAARGPLSGYDASSAREPMAARFYHRQYPVSRADHAVVRNRQLAAAALGYLLPGEFSYGLGDVNDVTFVSADKRIARPEGKYVVCLHATSRANKEWQTASWVALARRLHELGFTVVLPYGNAREEATSQRLAKQMPNAFVPPAMQLTAAAQMLAQATAVVGVDTGLAHLAVAVNRPTIGLYITTEPRYTGLYSGPERPPSTEAPSQHRTLNLGGGSPLAPAEIPVDAVWHALLPHVQAHT